MTLFSIVTPQVSKLNIDVGIIGIQIHKFIHCNDLVFVLEEFWSLILLFCQFNFFTALFLAFERNEYLVREDDGLLNNTVFVEKQDGRASEQTLPILVQLQSGSARQG